MTYIKSSIIEKLNSVEQFKDPLQNNLIDILINKYRDEYNEEFDIKTINNLLNRTIKNLGDSLESNLIPKEIYVVSMSEILMYFGYEIPTFNADCLQINFRDEQEYNNYKNNIVNNFNLSFELIKNEKNYEVQITYYNEDNIFRLLSSFEL